MLSVVGALLVGFVDSVNLLVRSPGVFNRLEGLLAPEDLLPGIRAAGDTVVLPVLAWVRGSFLVLRKPRVLEASLAAPHASYNRYGVLGRNGDRPDPGGLLGSVEGFIPSSGCGFTSVVVVVVAPLLGHVVLDPPLDDGYGNVVTVHGFFGEGDALGCEFDCMSLICQGGLEERGLQVSEYLLL